MWNVKELSYITVVISISLIDYVLVPESCFGLIQHFESGKLKNILTMHLYVFYAFIYNHANH